MPEPRIEFPEVVRKRVAEFFIHEDVEFGREVLVKFNDGKQLSTAIGVRHLMMEGSAKSSHVSRAVHKMNDS